MLENHLTKLDGQVAQSLGTISLEFITETVTGLTVLTNLNAVKWLQVQNIKNDIHSDTVVAMMINGDGSDRDGSISSGSSIVVNMLLVDYSY